ncbi:MAG: hypothetical protein LBO62_00305, partial [Endomicrobium sp.]|nr:hypothetical protein [Endomicrobium sp.]
SKDHYALRLEKLGFSRKQILLITYSACLLFASCAFLFTSISAVYSLLIFSFVLFLLWFASIKLAMVKMD